MNKTKMATSAAATMSTSRLSIWTHWVFSRWKNRYFRPPSSICRCTIFHFIILFYYDYYDFIVLFINQLKTPTEYEMWLSISLFMLTVYVQSSDREWWKEGNNGLPRRLMIIIILYCLQRTRGLYTIESNHPQINEKRKILHGSWKSASVGEASFGPSQLHSMDLFLKKKKLRKKWSAVRTWKNIKFSILSWPFHLSSFLCYALYVRHLGKLRNYIWWNWSHSMLVISTLNNVKSEIYDRWFTCWRQPNNVNTKHGLSSSHWNDECIVV